jgi:hypothetical protein
MIITTQPRSDNHIAVREPIITYLNVGEMSGPFNTWDIPLVTIIQIMVSRNKINVFKIIIEMLQCSQAVVQRDDVETGTVVVPIAQEQTGFATLLLGFGSGPFDEGQTVLVVLSAV